LVARNSRIGRYDLVTALATGGMGRIYLGRATGLGGFERKVVIKTLEVPTSAESDPAIAMFLDEARLLGLLHHQHIASVFEVGRDDDGRHFMVLDYVEGFSGHDVGERALQYGAALPMDFTLTVVCAAANALHYTHTRKEADGTPLGIVHRDVTPSNVMIGYDGAVKLIDFGIAMAAHRKTKTQTGFVKGKVGYLSPEQVSGRDVDPRTDVFALGILLYELSTLHRAFRETSDLATMQRIKAGKFTRPSQVVPGYPIELEAIVVKALQVEPRDRFPDADTMRRALEAFGHRARYVLGDAAVIEVMAQLFEPNAPGVASRVSSRASDPGFEWAASDHDLTIRRDPEDLLALMRRETDAAVERLGAADPVPPGAKPEPPPRKLRAATEVADALNENEDASGSASLTRVMSPPAVVPPVVRFQPSAAPGGAVAAVATEAAPAVAAPAPRMRPSPKTLIGAGVVEAEQRRRWPVRWISAISALSIAGAAVAYFERTPDPVAVPFVPPTPPVAARAPQPATKPAHVEPPPLPTPAKIRIQITSHPTDATVLLDGKKLGHTPLDETLDADPGKHVIKLRKLRYTTQRLDITLDADVTQELTLTRDK
jgi:eukaryotic-like serine/threonine-protein kinase